MPTERLSYAVVTPARNEAENLLRLADTLTGQTLRPAAWVIVDNGSTDDTPDVVRQLAAAEDWIHVVTVPGEATPTRGGPVARAFTAGVAKLEGTPDVIVKVDADISTDRDYFELLLERFAEDPALGIAGGTCYELEDGEWRARHVTGNRVRGASRAYRRECLQAVLPLEDRPGWDGIDEMRAAARGWRAASFADLPFYHHRLVGRRDESRWRNLFDIGRSAYYAGYRPSYLLFRSLWRARKELAALAMTGGYIVAAVRREPRCRDETARAYLRKQQALRELPLRAREALGRRSS